MKHNPHTNTDVFPMFVPRASPHHWLYIWAETINKEMFVVPWYKSKKPGTELKTSIYFNLVLKFLSGLVSHKVLRLGVKTIGWRTKVREQMPSSLPYKSHPKTDPGNKPWFYPLLLFVQMAVFNSFNRKVPPQSIRGLNSLAFPLILIQLLR